MLQLLYTWVTTKGKKNHKKPTESWGEKKEQIKEEEDEEEEEKAQIYGNRWNSWYQLRLVLKTQEDKVIVMSIHIKFSL